jgi:hypothetical protein
MLKCVHMFILVTVKAGYLECPALSPAIFSYAFVICTNGDLSFNLATR